ncbi:hypothetical protein LU646_17120 [Pseudomonas alloputida]|uniref:hypothetical protein n=1 Tax=Pseudomonas alloputida TaxID=1940621 RepID=UPI001E5931B1|nr:hypothetical protein [Pseudomonas alloputida]MCE1059605.1 hypothetical protein [Pseudomonas alloputida]
MRWNKLIIGVGTMLTTLSSYAAITNETGDINIGVSRDILQPTVVCGNATPFMKLFEFIANGQRDVGIKYFDKQISAGTCVQVPAQSVVVLGVKMASISGAERKVPSVYVVAKVKGASFVGYTAAQHLTSRGFDIIKEVQIVNKRLGSPLVQ